MEIEGAHRACVGSRSEGKSPLVLVVEDGAIQARLARICLERAGYRVIATPSGREALDMVRAQQPEVILLDVELADMNGFQVLNCIRADSHTRSIPVIMLTAHAKDAPLFDEWASEADAFVAKPFEPASLVATVEQSLRQAMAVKARSNAESAAPSQAAPGSCLESQIPG
jgi:CheY-like chemotaxis protein